MTTAFSPDYFTARQRFCDAVPRSGGRLEAIPLDAKGPNGEELGIDVAWFGSSSPKRVLLHSSGLHGVEGFAGSAIQLQFLDNVPLLPADTAFVMAHILNPYGMAHLRRFNENNVDLNRNFLDRAYAGSPETYAKLNAFLNPKSPPAADFYYLRVLDLILRHGMPALKQAVVGGQYEFPKGLFFGGARLEQGPERYQSFLIGRLSEAERVVAIDVHTGLGPYAEDSLLVETEDYEKLRPVFGERVKALQPEKSPAYSVEGGMQSMIFRVFTRRRPLFVCQEFGTYNGPKVLHALREENRWHHFGGGTLEHAAKRHLKQIFCPDDERWRQSVLGRGDELLKQAIQELARE